MGMSSTTDVTLALVESQEEDALQLVNRLDLCNILESGPVVNSIWLPEVPRNSLLVKGVLEGRHKPVPLMDMRLNFSGWDPAKTDPAIALIVEVDGKEVGLILDGGAAA